MTVYSPNASTSGRFQLSSDRDDMLDIAAPADYMAAAAVAVALAVDVAAAAVAGGSPEEATG
jgi:hypothetical protein